MKTVRLEICGRVQGVRYRASMVDQARALGVNGWVCSPADGSFKAILQGADDSLDRLVAWARRGPPAAAVGSVEAFPGQGEFEAFEQHPSG